MKKLFIALVLILSLSLSSCGACNCDFSASVDFSGDVVDIYFSTDAHTNPLTADNVTVVNYAPIGDDFIALHTVEDITKDDGHTIYIAHKSKIDIYVVEDNPSYDGDYLTKEEIMDYFDVEYKNGYFVQDTFHGLKHFLPIDNGLWGPFYHGENLEDIRSKIAKNNEATNSN